MIDKKLINKYNKAVPRYTSYPPANFFHSDISEDEYSDLIIQSNEQEPQAISLYFHIPFCPYLCHFCACNSCKIPGKSKVEEYVAAMEQELTWLSEKLNDDRPVRQVHWGGGTPNGISFRFIERIMSKVKELFRVHPVAEVAIEAHPGFLSREQLKSLKNAGFNRISLGIQDVHAEVLDNIHRKQPKLSVEKLMKLIREEGFSSVNADLVYGLPGQTEEHFIESLRQIIPLQPQRIVTFSYAHVPWVKEKQNKLNELSRLEGDAKLALFIKGKSMLEKAGYQALGLDHFALPGDPLAKAFQEHKLHRNFMGYALKEQTGQVYAVGASGISQLKNAFIQNEKDYEKYIQLIQNGQMPASKGYVISPDQSFTGEVITKIMCNGFVRWSDIAEEQGITAEHLKKITGFKTEKVEEMKKDGLLDYDHDYIKLTNQGWFFVRNVAALFDPMRKENSNLYSKSV